MAELEKVIKGLNYCTRLYLGCKKCPYFGTSTSKASCECQLKTDAVALLKEQPQIVRCKDCKFWDCVNDSYYGKCSQVFKGKLSPFDWFCADGERK